MNITKQQWTIIGVVIAVIAIWYFFLRKKPAESNYKLCEGKRNMWVSSTDENGSHCTWYDGNCNASTVYNLPCTKAQANMGQATV